MEVLTNFATVDCIEKISLLLKLESRLYKRPGIPSLNIGAKNARLFGSRTTDRNTPALPRRLWFLCRNCTAPTFRRLN